MPAQLLVSLAAGVGGVAPSLIHLAQGFIKPTPDVPGFFYFVGVAIFFVLGSLVAFAFSETSARKAFFLGIGLPALVATAQSQGVPKSVADAVIPSAHAQEAPSRVPAPRPSAASVTFKTATECTGCELWFADASGKIIAKEILSASPSEQQVDLPKDATSFGVADPKSNFRLVQVPKKPAAAATIEFDRKYSPLKDFRRGLGDYDLKSYDASVTWSVN